MLLSLGAELKAPHILSDLKKKKRIVLRIFFLNPDFREH